MALQEKLGIDERINEAFQPISNFWEGLILHEFFGTGIPTIIFLLVGGAAFISFVLSVSLWFYGYKDEGLFVGLWVPSILSFGCYFKQMLNK